MIIGIDASRANRKRKSGTEWYAFYLIKQLALIDKDNQYILYTDEPLAPDLVNLDPLGDWINEELYDTDGYQIIRSPHNNFRGKVLTWSFGYLWTHLRLSWEMLFHRPDVLFVPSHVLPLIHPRRSVVTIHDVGFERDDLLYPKSSLGPNDKFKKRLVNLLVRVFTRGRFGANVRDYLTWSTLYALKRASKIITVSKFSQQEVIDVYKKELPLKCFEKINVIHNGYSRECYKVIDDQPAIDKVLNKYGITRPFIFYLGRLERKKNTPRLVEAFGMMQQKIQGYTLVLTGRASFGYEEVEYMISEYRLDSKVLKTGWVSEFDLPYIFNGASAFIFPSHYEGFGIPLLEAMACNVPIAASNVAPIEEVAGDAALYFDPASAQSISDSLFRVLTDEKLANDLRAKGLARVEKFGWEITAAATLEVLKKA
ncbi:glycosyltransferase family 4 protein [Candidatus Falkowbacteria bacterium]|nr:glycosyltransferase family 4 protein [Candidatus Falkowbacteria bacterium]